MKINEFNRRDFLKLTGISTAGIVVAACGGAPAAGPAAPAAEAGADAAAAPAAAVGLADIPARSPSSSCSAVTARSSPTRNWATRTPPAPPTRWAAQRCGSRCSSTQRSPTRIIPWLATSYEYNDDFTELTVNLREGVKWSDGEPFNAEDVVFTIQMLKDNAPALTRSAAVDAGCRWRQRRSTTIPSNSPSTARAPIRVRPACMSKFDTGIYWVPEHVFKDVEDVAAFKYLRSGEGLAAGDRSLQDRELDADAEDHRPPRRLVGR